MRSIYARLHRRYGKKITGAQRQEFVADKISLQPLAAISPDAKQAALRDKARPKVAIVGAGFAGLMAGYALSNHCNVTVFEARSRVGGRVWSKSRPGGLVEAGGELIGYNHPLWLKLAKRFGLGLSLNTSDTNFDALDLDMPLYLDGTKMSEARQKTIYREMAKCFNRMSEHARAIKPHTPWRADNAEKLDATPLSAWIAHQECSGFTKLAMEQEFSNDAGQPTSKQSYLANLAVVRGGALEKQPDAFFTQSENLRCSEGNQALAECLEQEIRSAGGKVHLSRPVRSIRIDEGNVTLAFDGSAAAGKPGKRKRFTADYVVLAIPPSLWPGTEYEKISISPQLPHDYYVSMGTALKYLSPVQNRFWIKEGMAPAATSDRFGVTWEATDNQIAAPGKEVELSLFAGSDVARLALDEFANGGKRAVHAFYAERIGRVYKGYKANRARTPDFVAWPNDPWTRAGYSCPAPGEVCRAGPLLHKAFHKRMFFAGEHTCFAYFGYMEGALQSGRRAASSILRTIARRPKKRQT